jgi:ketosteroid isomerase-like protein
MTIRLTVCLKYRERERTMTLSENKSVALQFFEVLGRGDVDGLARMMTDDATWWVAASTPVSGTYEKKQFLDLVAAIFSKADGHLALDTKAVTAEDDRVCVMTSGHMRMKSGAIYANDYHFLLEIKDGKVKSGREYLDTVCLNAALNAAGADE